MSMIVETTGYEDAIVCENIVEGENGLFLQDEQEEAIGWVPYDNVIVVYPDDDSRRLD